MSLSCRHCGAAIPIAEPIGRETACDSCGRDLHACMQCCHYDPRYNNSCRETMADPVEDKERRNFCEYFSFDPEAFRAARPGHAEEARVKVEGLFKKPSATDPAAARPPDPKARLDSLFKKPRPDS